MATPVLQQEQMHPSAILTRAHTVWLIAVQVVTLGLTALALAWARVPKPSFQVLLMMLAVFALALSVVPRWRRGALAGVLGGITLAIACALSADRTLPALPGIDSLITDYVPQMALVITFAALVMTIWGLIARADLLDQSRLGVAAVASAVLIGVLLLMLLLILTYGVKMLNVMENWQFAELASMTLLYSLALWLGGVGIRPTCRWTILPFGTVIILITFLILWQRMPQ